MKNIASSNLTSFTGFAYKLTSRLIGKYTKECGSTLRRFKNDSRNSSSE
jgi:hypothetical protein